MMKKKIRRLLIISIMALLTACQATPTNDVVVNKNVISPKKTVSNGKLESGMPSTGGGIPDTYKDSFACLNDDVVVTVNAGVSILGDDTKNSTVRMKPHEITEDEVKKWGHVLLGKQIAYEPKTQYTKAELEEKIIMLKKANNPDTLLQEYEDEEAVNILQDFYNKEIAYYETIYNSAPDEIEKKECDWQFHPKDYYDIDAGLWEGNEEYESLKKSEEIAAVVVTEEGYEKYLLAVKRNKNDYKENSIQYLIRNSYEIKYDEKNPKLSKEDAANEVSKILRQLGLESWIEYESYTVQDESGMLYHFTYVPVYDGKTVFLEDIDEKSEDNYTANYNYASLSVNVLNGVLSSVYLTSPLDEVEIVEENVKTLPFEEIYACFKSQMENKYTISSFIQFGGSDMETTHSAEIKITSIKQGMFRVSEKNKDYSYVLTPVWRFTGEIFVDGSSWGESNVCYVNALDGSIIDPKLGY